MKRKNDVNFKKCKEMKSKELSKSQMKEAVKSNQQVQSR